MAVQIQLRRDTSANWTSQNPTLANGEPGLETDTGFIKYGNGVTAWSGLSYASGGDVSIDASDVSYDPTISGLTATNVKGALDEIAASVGGSSESLSEVISGGSGFVNVGGAINSGTVTLDLIDARVFHQTMTGNIALFNFANVPNTSQKAASWTWVLRIDTTGGYSFPTGGSLPAVTWVDGSGWPDLDLSANAQNTVTFWTEGAETKGAIITNGTLRLEPYVMSFPVNGTQGVPITRAETLDLANVTNLELDGTAGTGTVTFKKNGGANISVATSFASGDVLTVTMASSTTHSVISVPRYA